jgi:hypothetical protein
VEVGRGKQIDTLEEEKWEREVLEDVEQRTGILRSDAGMEMEGRRGIPSFLLGYNLSRGLFEHVGFKVIVVQFVC